MTHVVCQPCYDCKYTDCVAVCPVECFWQDEKMLYIHPDDCIDCEACVPECPVEAIFVEANVPPQWVSFNALNATLAVIKWKKLRGYYHDPGKEHFCAYTIANNRMANEDKA